VLWHRPDNVQQAFDPAMRAMEVDGGAGTDEPFRAWCDGRTGYPIVDAGMRQLLGEGWMHNRVRMIVASFLVKDLHLDWTRGARWFLRHLVDGDLASNQHGWQWVAGPGPTPRRTSASSTPSARASATTRTAMTCGAGCPSCGVAEALRRYAAVKELRG
jgi:deoxyribodipyrimidine photo-lyase